MPQVYQIVVANPTSSDVQTPDGVHVAKARRLSIITIDAQSSVHWTAFIDAGCSIGPYNTGTMRQRQQGGFLLHMLQNGVTS